MLNNSHPAKVDDTSNIYAKFLFTNDTNKF